MDTEIEDIVVELGNELRTDGSDNVTIQKWCLELKTELFMKRSEAKQCRQALDIANNEITILKKELNVKNNQLTELKYSWTVLNNKLKGLDEELCEKRNGVLKLQMQYKMAIGEVDVLKETLLQTKSDYNKMVRKLELNEAKQMYNSNYLKEIMERENSVKHSIEEINSTITKLQSEQTNLRQLTNMVNLANETKEELTNFTKHYVEAKIERDKIEALYVKENAKCDTLEGYLSKFDKDFNLSNIITKVIFNQYQLHKLKYREDMKEKNDILSKLQSAYENERNTNLQIILQNEKLQSQLRSVLDSNIIQPEKIKTEVIAIIDD